MVDLFLSHVEEDSFFVKELGEALEAEGYSTWDYKKDARPVVDHRTQTRDAIEEAAAFVLFVSPRTLDQPQHVRREVVRAAQLDKPFIPLLLDVPYEEFSEREPTWEDAIAGAVATPIPPEGPGLLAPDIAASLRRMGIEPSIPTTGRPGERPAGGQGVDGKDGAAPDAVLVYRDRHYLVATELADALESEGISVWYYERDLLREKASGRAPVEERDPGTDDEESPVVKLTDMLFRQALEDRATEIHIVPEQRDVRISFRVDGVLTEVMGVPGSLHAGLLSRLKILADLDIADRERRQSGQAEVTAGGRAARIAVATDPGPFGERAVVLILDSALVRASIEGATALIMLFRREASGRPQLPTGVDEARLLGRPLLLVQVEEGQDVPDPDPLWDAVHTESTLIQMPDGVTPTVVGTLVEKLRDLGVEAKPAATRVQLVLGDITDQKVDAIVNAANPTLMGGGGVDGAIHEKGGPQILNECKRIRRERYPQGLPTGQAVATTAGRLPATWVIHTVGPVHSSSEDRSALLASCHTESLRVADELGARSVAFPAISTGAFGYPVEEAAPVAVEAVRSAATRVELVRFVVFDRAPYQAFERALGSGPAS